jgi:hypothetical protein
MAGENAQVLPNNPVIDKWALFDRIGYDVTHPEVRRFHDSKARVKVAVAPRRGSKSYAASHDVMDECLLPNRRIWVVGPSYNLAEKEFRYIHQKLVLERNKHGLPKPKTCLTNPRSGQLMIVWPWGTILEGKSADRPDGLLGDAINRIIYSEAAQLPRAIRERYTHPTVITTKGTEIIPTTPDQSGEWVNELFELGAQPEYPEIASFHWDVTANPTYDLEELERARKFYGEDSPVFQEQYLGMFVYYAGRVYNHFYESTHVIEPFDIPRRWSVVRAIDFGHRDPFVTLWGAVGPEGELYIYNEYYNTKGGVMREHARHIEAQSRNRNIVQSVGDPAARQSIDDLRYEGVSVMEANNDRAAGRLRVLEYMISSESGVPPYPIRDMPASKAKNKWPRIYIFNTCKNLIRELKYFRWKEHRAIEGDRERTEGDDHACDALRYLVMTRPSPTNFENRVPRNSFEGYMSLMKTQRAERAYIGV